MTLVLLAGMIVTGVLIVAAIVLIAVALATRRPQQRDDQVRAGSPTENDVRSATLRASGTNAWMRPGGGGL